MSVAQIILFVSWLADGNLAEKIKMFIRNKTAVIVSSVFILHLAGLTYTSDFTYGLGDVKRKIPLMLLPLIFSTSPQLSKELFEKLLLLFIASVVASSLVCFYVLLGYTDKKILGPQEASVFISHIRLGLLISMSVFSLVYFLFTKSSLIIKIICVASILWLMLFLIMLESLTGLLCIIMILSVYLIYYTFKTKSLLLKLCVSVVFVGGIYFIINYLVKVNESVSAKPRINPKELPTLTKKGNPYYHDTLNKETENGNYVWINFCEKELSEEWNKRSSLNYFGRDLKGNEIKYTLVRFLTSKGTTKDAAGVAGLTQEEIESIEKGIPNVNYMGIFNPTARIHRIFWELNNYLNGGNPSGHSVAQRLEFWKAAVGIISNNILFGVGTGDTFNEFKNQYERMNSPLTQEWRLRSHNQFLAIGTAFGMIGMIWFCLAFFYPLFSDKRNRNFFYLTFFTLAVLSMLTEDTLETQAGVTFFAFFNSLFLFLYKKE